jgi:hypothetical protein
MPRRHKHRRRTMKGGFLDDLSNTLSGWGSSLSQGASSMWEKTKNTTSSLTGSTPSNGTSSYNTPSYTNAPMTTSTFGGKHSRRIRRMRGGFKDNTPTTGLATHAAPISGVSTANAHNWVGGKTRRRGRKGCKSHRRHKH